MRPNRGGGADPRPKPALRLAALLALAAGAVATGRCSEPPEATQPVPKPGIGLPVQVAAPAGTHYTVDCHMRTQRNAGGGISNRYAIDNRGAYSDVIPSANAQCTLAIIAGAGPVTLTVTKPGAGPAKTATAAAAGQPAYLQVW